MISCSQHDAKSVIDDQRIPCDGKVFAISYVARDAWSNIVTEGETTVCEVHAPSFEARGLESHGYTLGLPIEIGVIGENSETPTIDLEREG